MNTVKASFPYPILGHGDDIHSQWLVNDFTYTPTTEDVEVRFRYHCDDPDWKRLVDDGQVTVMACWECSATISSGVVARTNLIPHSDGATFIGTIDQRDVRDDVKVHVLVVASQDIPNLRWSRQHEDYGNASFSIRTGDVLSTDNEFDFDAKKLYDPANPPLNSCFRFIVDSDKASSRELVMDYGDSKQIIVRVPKRIFDALRMMGDKPTLQISLLVFPALIDAIAHMTDKDTQDTSCEWYRTLERMMHEYKVDLENPLRAAQKLLGYPLYKYTDECMNNNVEEENEQ